MENTNDYFGAWLKAQQQGFDLMRQQAEWMQGMTQGTSSPDNPFESWRASVMKAVDAGTDSDAVRDTLTRAFGSSNAFQKLYEMWQPLIKAIQAKAGDPEALKQQLDPAAVKAMVDRLFNFDGDALAEFQKQVSQMTQQFDSNAEHFGKPWAAAATQNLQLFPQFVEGHPEALMKMFHNAFGAFESTFGRSFHVPAVGKDREKMELVSRCIDDMTVYLSKNAEFQHAMYLTGLEATEKVVAALALKVEEGQDVSRFDDFFDLWIDVHEKTFYATFQTSEYARLKGELLEAGLNARKHYFKLMEIQLFDLPIALRSEMDDLYKTLYDLRKKVKRLEAKRKEQQS
ncbi:MAG: hypothetical protein FGM62_03425 [Methylobacterium sp.]|nr:hypothetical protein [Methylobacterium sp.]